MIYWDTSCVIKLYAREYDSSLWQKIATTDVRMKAGAQLLGIPVITG